MQGATSSADRGSWPSKKLRIWTKDELDQFESSQSANPCQENKSMLYECPPHFNCSNQTITRFQPEGIHLDEIKTDGRGYGLQTSCDLIKDQAIIEVIGNVMSEWKVSSAFCVNVLLIAVGRIYYSP